jgi:hypothetical protein
MANNGGAEKLDPTLTAEAVRDIVHAKMLDIRNIHFMLQKQDFERLWGSVKAGKTQATFSKSF